MSGPAPDFWTGKTLTFVSFSHSGMALARKLQQALGGTCTDGQAAGFSLARWTETAFAQADALVFVGASGIAVRAIAPHVCSKTTDPAVVAVDEGGRFAVPLLSGHLGGANALAHRVAAVFGAVAVITTATDGHGVFAVDEWARNQGCAVQNPGAIKTVSAKRLAGETIRVQSRWPVTGEPPQGVLLCQEGPWDVRLSMEPGPGLWLVPRCLVLGVGCRKGTEASALEGAFAALLERTGLPEAGVCAVATIDLKAAEPGLLAFCAAHGWPLESYSAQELAQAAGDFSASAFVQSITGVDNVCERSAVLASGGGLLERKQAGNGVTLAVAQKPFAPDWRWRDA